MKKTLAGGLCAWMLMGCILENQGISPEVIRTRIHANREIRDTAWIHGDSTLYEGATVGFAVEAGERDLFEYYRRAEDKVSVADDEFSEAFYFLVAPGTENLVIDSSSFAAHKPRYVPRAFSVPAHGVVDSGTITIRKTGTGRYRVKADVGFEIRYEAYAGYQPPPERGRLRFERDFRR